MVKTAEPGAFSPEDFQRYRSIWSQKGAMTAMLAWYRALLRYRPRALKDNRIRVPTLILWGRKDHVFESKIAEASAELCQQGNLIFSDDAGHWLHHEEPNWVNEEILNFLGTAG